MWMSVNLKLIICIFKLSHKITNISACAVFGIIILWTNKTKHSQYEHGAFQLHVHKFAKIHHCRSHLTHTSIHNTRKVQYHYTTYTVNMYSYIHGQHVKF